MESRETFGAHLLNQFSIWSLGRTLEPTTCVTFSIWESREDCWEPPTGITYSNMALGDLEPTYVNHLFYMESGRLLEPTTYWPSAIWGKYGQQLSDFKEVSNRDGAIQCLNHMITDAMRHLPFSIEHMSKVRDVQVFRFCAIPQIMAIATLAMCYNNGKVFEGVVKMKRGKVSTVFTKCSNMGDLFGWFLRFLHMLAAKLDAPDMAGNDPTLPDMRKAVSSSIQLCQGNLDQIEIWSAADWVVVQLSDMAENDPTLPDMRKGVSSSIQLCQGNLDQWRKDNPSTTVWPLLMDLCALAGSGTYALYALNLGGSHTAQPEIGQMLGIGSSGPLQTAHVLLSVLLLVLLSLRRIFVAR
eukprot:gene464-1870_t